jgi:hypothetical protein
MEYLCLIYTTEAVLAGLGPVDCATVERERLAYEDTLRSSGQPLAVRALRCVGEATIVRVRGGIVTVSDATFAGTRAPLAGFYLLEARDLNDAVRLAAKNPPAPPGRIEILPIRTVGAG